MQSSKDRKARRLKELDVVSKLKELIMWGPEEEGLGAGKGGGAREPFTVSLSSKVAPSKMQPGSEALKMAELHGRFGHW